MDIPEKLATLGTQDDEKHNNNTTEYVLDTTIRKQTQIMYIKHESSYKQMMVKTNRTSFVCGRRHGAQNIKPHNRTAQKAVIFKQF